MLDRLLAGLPAILRNDERRSPARVGLELTLAGPATLVVRESELAITPLDSRITAVRINLRRRPLLSFSYPDALSMSATITQTPVLAGTLAYVVLTATTASTTVTREGSGTTVDAVLAMLNGGGFSVTSSDSEAGNWTAAAFVRGTHDVRDDGLTLRYTLGTLADELAALDGYDATTPSDQAQLGSWALAEGSYECRAGERIELPLDERVLTLVLGAGAEALRGARAAMDEVMPQVHPDRARGVWLDDWGDLVGVPRLTVGSEAETDDAYRRRIVWELFAPRANNGAMARFLKGVLGLADAAVTDTPTPLNSGSPAPIFTVGYTGGGAGALVKVERLGDGTLLLTTTPPVSDTSSKHVSLPLTMHTTFTEVIDAVAGSGWTCVVHASWRTALGNPLGDARVSPTYPAPGQVEQQTFAAYLDPQTLTLNTGQSGTLNGSGRLDPFRFDVDLTLQPGGGWNIPFPTLVSLVERIKVWGTIWGLGLRGVDEEERIAERIIEDFINLIIRHADEIPDEAVEELQALLLAVTEEPLYPVDKLLRTIKPPVAIGDDGFTGTAGSAVAGTVIPGGAATWIETGSAAWQRSGTGLSGPSAGSGVRRLMIDTGSTNAVVRATTGFLFYGASLCARMNAAGTDGYVIYIGVGGGGFGVDGLYIGKRTAGVYSLLASYPIVTTAFMDITLSVQGSTISLGLDGVTVLSVNDTSFTTGTYAGLGLEAGTTTSLFDRVRIWTQDAGILRRTLLTGTAPPAQLPVAMDLSDPSKPWGTPDQAATTSAWNTRQTYYDNLDLLVGGRRNYLSWVAWKVRDEVADLLQYQYVDSETSVAAAWIDALMLTQLLVEETAQRAVDVLGTMRIDATLLERPRGKRPLFKTLNVESRTLSPQRRLLGKEIRFHDELLSLFMLETGVKTRYVETVAEVCSAFKDGVPV